VRGCWAWRGWDRGAGPRALLACPSGERHDFGLIILGLALRDRGWRVTFLGPATPIETLAAAADQLAGSPIEAAGKVFA
jgi:MerR family transcriptional regulator, light-induced transcriptional regulator